MKRPDPKHYHLSAHQVYYSQEFSKYTKALEAYIDHLEKENTKLLNEVLHLKSDITSRKDIEKLFIAYIAHVEASEGTDFLRFFGDRLWDEEKKEWKDEYKLNERSWDGAKSSLIFTKKEIEYIKNLSSQTDKIYDLE